MRGEGRRGDRGPGYCVAARALPAIAVIALLGVVATGCNNGTRTTAQSSLRSPASQQTSDDFSGVTMDDRALRSVTNKLVRAEVRLHSHVPYDNMSMPLVSPDGRYIATQTRVSPTWPTLLAEWDADVPVATRLEIFTRPDEGMVEHHVSVHQPLILGRSFDDRGFLVEAPQEDGSRWIGYVEWSTGELHWLVADEFVNAFPALGPEGRLAWSRRAVDGDDTHFELVVRGPQAGPVAAAVEAAGQAAYQWTYTTPHESWLMPTWSGRGAGLFLLALTGDLLEAVSVHASDPSAFRQSQQRIPLARHATVHTAYQVIGAQICSPNLHQPRMPEQFVFFHPSRMRMAVWRPFIGSMSDAVMLLNRNSFTAWVDENDRAFVTTENDLIIQQVDRPSDRAELLSGTLVARPVNRPEWRYVLLAPADGRVSIASMRPYAGDDPDIAQR